MANSPHNKTECLNMMSFVQLLPNFPTCYAHSFPCGPADKESACSAGDLGLIPGLGIYPGEGNGYPPQ